jgi:hypothetical protein
MDIVIRETNKRAGGGQKGTLTPQGVGGFGIVVARDIYYEIIFGIFKIIC